jgi:ornithine cyclodeaminase
MLILKRPEIEGLVNIEKVFPAIEKAYLAMSKGLVNLPPVGHITFPKLDADCHIKYGHIEDDAFFVIKIATGFPLNSDQGLSNGNGILLVLSAKTGAIIAMLHDEMHLTDVRTGIGGAIASHLLARDDAKRVLIVGTGIQARMQIETHAARFDNTLEFTVWGRSYEKAKALTKEIAEQYSIQIAEDLETACKQADIIVTTTGSTEPLIKSDWIKSGTHITAIGADALGKQELETELISKADVVVVDSINQCTDHGEIEEAVKKSVVQMSSLVELGELISNKALGRKSSDQITITDLTGVAAQDIAIAGVVLDEYRSS